MRTLPLAALLPSPVSQTTVLLIKQTLNHCNSITLLAQGSVFLTFPGVMNRLQLSQHSMGKVQSF